MALPNTHGSIIFEDKTPQEIIDEINEDLN